MDGEKDLIMTDGYRNVLRLEKGILGECLRQLPNHPNNSENCIIFHQEELTENLYSRQKVQVLAVSSSQVEVATGCVWET